MRSVLDFHLVARLIDGVLGATPENVPTLFQVLSSSDERLEARVVLELALFCRDPLAPLESLCRDALKTAATMDGLLRKQKVEIEQANGLLNLADTLLSRTSPYLKARRGEIKAVHPQIKVAAVAELRAKGDAIEQVHQARSVAIPNLWELMGQFVADVEPPRDLDLDHARLGGIST